MWTGGSTRIPGSDLASERKYRLNLPEQAFPLTAGDPAALVSGSVAVGPRERPGGRPDARDHLKVWSVGFARY